jgi:hypothetical protein
LGVICGLGALTKATFFPFLAATSLLLLYRTLRREISPWQFLAFLLTVVAVAGWWYLQRSAETRMLFAMTDAMDLREKGGVIAGLMQHFSVQAMAWTISAAGMSFLWGSTWSFVTPPLMALVPLIAMLLLISCAFLSEFYSYRMYPLVQITLLTLVLWAAAIIYPTLVFIASAGFLGTFAYGGYPGYYLHSFAPALAPAVAIALTAVGRHWLPRTVACLLLSYNIAFLLGATFMQFLYFAGCGSNGSNRFNIAFASACWQDWQRLRDNLDVLAYPLTASWLAAGGVIALSCGALASLALARPYSRSKTGCGIWHANAGRKYPGTTQKDG